MAGSLRDQLLKSGLVDEKKAKQLAKEKRDDHRQQKQSDKHAGKQAVSAAAEEARRQKQQVQAEQAARDRELNREKEAKAARKALYVELRQLIASNRVERGKDGQTGYRFRDGTKIEKIYVNDALQQQLARGQLGITRIGKEYQLVPAEVIAKIRERDPENTTRLYIALATADEKPAEDDPYAQFQVPDDLTW